MRVLFDDIRTQNEFFEGTKFFHHEGMEDTELGTKGFLLLAKKTFEAKSL